MQNTALQAQLADYISACAFEPFEYTVDTGKLQLFTIRTPQAFSRPLIEFSEALEARLTQVTEVDEQGSVQELTVSNLSGSYLLIYESTILKGGKQNRVINATQLIPPHSKHVIPVSCIEQGRWRRTSSTFQKSPHHSPSFMRSSIRKQIIEAKRVSGNQSRVWDEIRGYSNDKGVQNASSDFEDIYNRSHKEGLLFPSGLLLPPTEGVLLQVDGEYTLDLIASAEVFGKVLPQISAGYEYAKRKEAITLTDNPGLALSKIIQNSTCFAQPAAAIGIDVRIGAAQTNISALIVDGEVVSATITSI